MIKRILEENRVLTSKNIKLERTQTHSMRSLELKSRPVSSKFGSARSVTLGDAKIKLSKGTILMDRVSSRKKLKARLLTSKFSEKDSPNKRTGRLRPEAKPNVPYEKVIKKLVHVGNYLKNLGKRKTSKAEKKSLILGT